MTEVKMHKCEHNQKISKFCLSEHCQAKESGGCEQCIKKYHNHIGHTQFITEEEVYSIVKKYQTEQMYRPKYRPLQQSLYNYFSYMKNTLANNFDIVCKSMINQTGYPYLHDAGILNCYKRLKNKQYRKVYQKQLKELYENYSNISKQRICEEECQKYMQASARIADTLYQIQKKVKQVSQIFNKLNTNNVQQYDSSYYFKANQILKEIQKYPTAKTKKNIVNNKAKQQQRQQEKKQQKNVDIQNGKNSPIKQQKKKLNRQVSLDKKLAVEPHFNRKAPSNQKPREETPPDSKQLFQQIKQKLINNQAKLKISNNQKIQVPEKQISDKNKLLQPISQKKQSLTMSASRQSKSAKPKDQVVEVKYTQKQTQINQKKQILMNLMNSKGTNKKLHTEGVQLPDSSDKIVQKQERVSPIKRPMNMRNIQTSPPKIKYESPQRFLINKNFLTPSNPISKASYYEEFSKKSYEQVAKRVKTSNQYQDSSVSQQNKYTLNTNSVKNDTLPSSEQETNQLFGAKSLIPFQDLKNDEQIQQKQESTQKRIIVPQIPVNTEKVNEIDECQSPMIKKMRQSDLFCGLKLTESKVVESVSRQTISKEQSQKSSEEFKKQSSQSSPTSMKKQQQNSIKLLLEALSLPAQKAIPLLQKSLQFSPSNLSAGQYLSYLYLDNNQPQQCLKLCNDILKLISNPQNNELSKTININKSAALNHLGRYSQCITFLQKCLRYTHNDVLYKNLADAYYSIGILQKSIYNYEHSIIENRNNAQAHYNLAVCHYNQENFHNASIYVDKAVKVDPQNKIYQELKKYVEQKILNEPI